MSKNIKMIAELFWIPVEHLKDKKVVQSIIDWWFINPFTWIPSKKQSRLINYPFAVDSVYWNDKVVIIDPVRFLQDKIIFRDIAKNIWWTEENVIPLSEVKLKNIWSFDFVLVKHKKFSYEIEDFCLIEIQSDSTTWTWELVKNYKDLFEKWYEKINPPYKFWMNTYNTIKLSFMQMLIKWMVAEKWGKHINWVMQDFVFDNMLNRFDIWKNPYTNEKNTHYFIYWMQRKNEADIFHLNLESKHSYDVTELKRAFDSERDLPTLDYFMNILKKRLISQLWNK